MLESVFKMSNLENKNLKFVPQVFYDKFWGADIGHICQKVQQSLTSLTVFDFKMREPQITTAIWTEFGHEIRNGLLSSWLTDMPSS